MNFCACPACEPVYGSCERAIAGMKVKASCYRCGCPYGFIWYMYFCAANDCQAKRWPICENCVREFTGFKLFGSKTCPACGVARLNTIDSHTSASEWNAPEDPEILAAVLASLGSRSSITADSTYESSYKKVFRAATGAPSRCILFVFVAGIIGAIILNTLLSR